MLIASDLHGHSAFSDGRATPEDYVAFRRELGMRVIALADHDVLSGVRRAAQAATQAGMLLVPAAEMTAFIHFGTSSAEQVHVLAYWSPDVLRGPRMEATYFWKRGRRVQEKWQAFVLEWLQHQDADARARLDPDGELERLACDVFPALQTMIDRIVARARPLFEPFRDHHWRFWNDDAELFGWSPEEMIEAIRADGAVDVVAHPARYRDQERTPRVLDLATGLEVYTSRHKPEVATAYRAYAAEKRKLWTASADDHQNARYVRPPCGTPVATLERFLRRPLPLELILAA